MLINRRLVAENMYVHVRSLERLLKIKPFLLWKNTIREDFLNYEQTCFYRVTGISERGLVNLPTTLTTLNISELLFLILFYWIFVRIVIIMFKKTYFTDLKV
jgi:hypothetical protein